MRLKYFTVKLSKSVAKLRNVEAAVKINIVFPINKKYEFTLCVYNYYSDIKYLKNLK